MKNTIENRSRFNALYHGQKLAVSFLEGVKRINKVDCINTIDYLELKPLSQITDEEAISALMISLYEPKNNFKGEVTEAVIYYKAAISFESTEADFLRGNGYALDWTTPEGETITVSEMIEFGWIKIKE